MNSDIRQLLTAYVLGETDAEETARIEALLAEDGEQGELLRAERTRLEGTIALVQAHAAPDLALSDARRDQLMAASGAGEGGAGESVAVLTPQPSVAGRVVPFYRRPVFAAAAGLFVVAGLGIALVATQPGALPMFEMNAQREGAAVEDSIATNEAARPSDTVRTEESQRAADRAALMEMGYASGDGAEKANPYESGLADALGIGGGAKGGGAKGGHPPVGEQPNELLRALGYSDGFDIETVESPFDAGGESFVGVASGSDPAADPNQGWTVAPGLQATGSTADGEASGGLAGRPGGIYRGAGDTVPPGSASQWRALEPRARRGVPAGPGAAPVPGALAPNAPGSAAGVPVQKNGGGFGQAQYFVAHGEPVAEESPEEELEAGAQLERLRLDVGSGDFFLGDEDDDGSLELRAGNAVDARLVELLSRAGYVDGGEDAFGLELQSRDRHAVELLGDYDAMRAYERELMRNQGLEPNDTGLRRLLEGLGYVDPGYGGPVDTPELLDARWKLFGAKIREARRRAMEARIDLLLADTCRRPGESLRDMFFRHWGTSPFTKASDDPVSTFAADVDTSSYTLARKMLDSGVLPTAAQIRPEEWVNYFDAELPEPAEGETFRITTEIAPNPFYPGRLGEPTWLLRVGLQGKAVEEHERSGLALTFVVDTSGSMGDGNRIELVRNAMRQLLTKLDSRDALAIVAFNNSATTVIPMTSATDRGRIEAAISSLGANGGTNVEGGLTLGYQLASDGFDSERENRVVLLSDGVGNIGETDQEALLAKVEQYRTDKRIYLNTIGVGLENHNDVFLEQLANKGDGVSDYVDTQLEARRAFVENFTGAFQTIARDVKIQVDFDPTQIGEYRLVGYENRAVADRAFRDDRVDGGEVGAGHSVVAIYELRGVNLGYSESTPDYELGTVSVRYKRPGNDEAAETAVEIAESISFSDTAWTFDAAPIGLRKNVLVARTAEILKRSHHARGSSFDVLADQIAKVANESTEEEFRSFAGLFARNRAAIEALVRPPSPAEAKLDELKHLRYELELEKTTVGEPDPKQVEQLTKRIDELTEELRRHLLDGVTQNEPTPAPAPTLDGDDR